MHLRHTVISFVLLLLVFAAGLTAQSYTEATCRDILTVIDKGLQAEPAECGKIVTEAVDRFSAQAKTLAMFHHHSAIDTITVYLQRAAAYAGGGFYQEMRSELTAARAALKTLATRDTLTLENIF